MGANVDRYAGDVKNKAGSSNLEGAVADFSHLVIAVNSVSNEASIVTTLANAGEASSDALVEAVFTAIANAAEAQEAKAKAASKNAGASFDEALTAVAAAASDVDRALTQGGITSAEAN